MMTKKPPSSESSKNHKASSKNSTSSKNSKKTEDLEANLKKTGKSPSPYEPRPLKGPKTRIVVKYDVGFSNSLYLRGKGASLSWDKGVCLKNLKADEWVWETDAPFTNCEFKVLINDSQYEIGENHRLTCGANIHYTPKF